MRTPYSLAASSQAKPTSVDVINDPRFPRGPFVTMIGFALIAVTYGLVRFSYGQFLPAIRADLGLSEGLAGVISSALFLGNCASLLIAAYAAERYGPRIVATCAAVVACVGLAVMSLSQEALPFAIALMCAGSAAGLSFPPFVIAVRQTVRPSGQARSTSIINAGTCAGIVLSGPIALYMAGDWRWAFGGFAVIALIVACATVLILPGRSAAVAPQHAAKDAVWTNPKSRPLLFSALAFGASSAVFWTFGADILANLDGWQARDLSVFWIVIGCAGLVGAGTGIFIQRWTLDHLHKTGFVLLAAAIILLSMVTTLPGAVYAAAVLFGAAYMIQTSLYVIWAMRQMPDHAAILVAAAFFMLPLGQIAGSVLMGYGMQTLGIDASLSLMALFTLGACIVIPARSETQPAGVQPVVSPALPDATTRMMAPANVPADPAWDDAVFATTRIRRPKLFFLHPRAESLSPEFKHALKR